MSLLEQHLGDCIIGIVARNILAGAWLSLLTVEEKIDRPLESVLSSQTAGLAVYAVIRAYLWLLENTSFSYNLL